MCHSIAGKVRFGPMDEFFESAKDAIDKIRQEFEFLGAFPEIVLKFE